jgi:hypothetical protein
VYGIGVATKLIEVKEGEARKSPPPEKVGDKLYQKESIYHFPADFSQEAFVHTLGSMVAQVVSQQQKQMAQQQGQMRQQMRQQPRQPEQMRQQPRQQEQARQQEPARQPEQMRQQAQQQQTQQQTTPPRQDPNNNNNRQPSPPRGRFVSMFTSLFKSAPKSVPLTFYCGLSRQLMTDPVTLGKGTAHYERQALLSFLKDGRSQGPNGETAHKTVTYVGGRQQDIQLDIREDATLKNEIQTFKISHPQLVAQHVQLPLPAGSNHVAWNQTSENQTFTSKGGAGHNKL